MPKSKNEYPSKDEFIDYLKAYEKRYDFPVQRDTKVTSVNKEKDLLKVTSNQGLFYAKTLISTTGIAKNPFTLSYPKRAVFMAGNSIPFNTGMPNHLKIKKTLVVGGRKFNCSNII